MFGLLQLSTALMSFGEFGAIKADLYSQLLPTVLSGRFDDVTPTKIHSLTSSLLGMAMVNIYPHALYHELFSARLGESSHHIHSQPAALSSKLFQSFGLMVGLSLEYGWNSFTGGRIKFWV